MKKVTCISYHGTGSGAVDDLLKEFDNFASGPSEFEFRLLHDPDGISDLEHNLVNNPHRLNSGFAIKRFERYCKYLNRNNTKLFGDAWKKCTEKYIDSLIKFRYNAYWQGDLWLIPEYKYYFFKFRRLLAKVSPPAIRKPNYYNYFPNIETYHVAIDEDNFLRLTQRYLEGLCKGLNKENKEYVLLDQAVPTMNIQRYLRYVKNMKVIIVDRDPRDTYINHQKGKDHVLPKDPEQFAVAYRDYRRTLKTELEDKKHILRIQFEDLIYNYEDTVERIVQFLGTDSTHHIKPKTVLKPEVSIKNTKQWEKLDGYLEAVQIIEKMLPEYLFDFPEDSSRDISE